MIPQDGMDIHSTSLPNQCPQSLKRFGPASSIDPFSFFLNILDFLLFEYTKLLVWDLYTGPSFHWQTDLSGYIQGWLLLVIQV